MNALTRATVPTGGKRKPETVLVRYEAMCRAIDQAYEVDEVKDIHDTALAIEIYARQAKNYEAERRACEIRLRAERKGGNLLRKKERSKGGRPTQNSSHDGGSFRQSCEKSGISPKQAETWQKLAEVPEDLFEEEVVKPGATTSGIIAAYKKPKHPIDLIDEKALWLHGRLKDFRRNGILAIDPETICETMLPHMQEEMRELVPLVIGWLGRIKL